MSDYFRDELSPKPRLKLTREMLEHARIPTGYWDCEVSKIPSRLHYQKAIQTYVDELPARDKGGRGLYLYGPYGTGKTGAAVAIIKEAMRRGGRSVFISALELESVFGKHLDNKFREDVLRTHFLIFDDVGAEKQISWSPQWVETIIKLRNNNNLPTIITSNDKPADFMGRIKSVASILGGKYDAVQVSGYDWRMDGPPTIE